MRKSIVLALLCWSVTASAEEADCFKVLTQGEMNTCVGNRYKAAAQKLDDVYRALMHRVGDDGGPGLRDAESKWAAFRDAQCAFETSGTQGGSVHPFVLGLCLIDLTESQTRRLNAQLHCEEGDLSCSGR